MTDPVSVLLTVVPIAVSAVGQYSKASKCISRYIKYDKEIDTVVKTLNIQQTIFRNAIRSLLITCVNENEASQMLDDDEHPSWREAEVDAHIRNRLAGSCEAFGDMAAMITGHIRSLEKFSSDCEEAVLETEKQKTIDMKKICRRVRKRIEFSFSENRVDELLQKIRNLTQDFRVLIDQTEPARERQGVSKAVPETRRKVATLAGVKTAAGNLYQALGLACTKHTEHQAHLSLQPAHGDPRKVQFTVAYTQLSMNVGPRPNGIDDSSLPLWLTVQSGVTGTIQSCSDINLLTELHSSQKRPRESVSPPPPLGLDVVRKKPKKSVRFENLVHSSAASQADSSASDILPNFCAHSNFCNQLQKIVLQPLLGADHCVGYLECSGASKHLIYLKSKTQSITAGKPERGMVSLSMYFAEAYRATLPNAGLLQHERIRLARQLATAVLQFQATPWLEKSWDSNHILVSNADEELDDLSTVSHEAFVNVPIKGPLGPPSRSNTFPSRTLIRNRLLFSLGVMLLELAFQKPFSDLRKAADVDANEDRNTDYFTADRVQRQASIYMGPRYAEVARKCIQCDFGHGSDLNETKLQEGFYQDVICELEVLEKRFQDFSLNI